MSTQETKKEGEYQRFLDNDGLDSQQFESVPVHPQQTNPYYGQNNQQPMYNPQSQQPYKNTKIKLLNISMMKILMKTCLIFLFGVAKSTI